MQKRVALLLVTALSACALEQDNSLVFGETMGTTWRLTLPQNADAEAAYGVVQAELDLVEELMSPWRQESDLSRFADAEVGDPVQVARETLEVLEIARGAWRASAGAFDPTVGALVEASGFGVAEGLAEPS
ncbi:MAG: FAD:protein FMN transferase, partial [Planctomycetes bacterium]|nr:FAD:protein FMN transferase [Planctomycetota bacterium]